MGRVSYVCCGCGALRLGIWSRPGPGPRDKLPGGRGARQRETFPGVAERKCRSHCIQRATLSCFYFFLSFALFPNINLPISCSVTPILFFFLSFPVDTHTLIVIVLSTIDSITIQYFFLIDRFCCSGIRPSHLPGRRRCWCCCSGSCYLC